jgi:hypothetical protein
MSKSITFETSQRELIIIREQSAHCAEEKLPRDMYKAHQVLKDSNVIRNQRKIIYSKDGTGTLDLLRHSK